jgi:hypothetical protein
MLGVDWQIHAFPLDIHAGLRYNPRVDLILNHQMIQNREADIRRYETWITDKSKNSLGGDICE